MSYLNEQASHETAAEINEDFSHDEISAQNVIPATWCLNDIQLTFIQSLMTDGNNH